MMNTEHYGPFLASFSGNGDVCFSNSSRIMEGGGHFHATQTASWRIFVSFVPTMSFVHSLQILDNGFSFAGRDMDRRMIQAMGETLYSRLSWGMSPLLPNPSEYTFYPSRLSAKSLLATTDSYYSNVRFSLSNFLWHTNSSSLPEPIEITTDDFAVVVEPVNDYSRVSRRLTATHSIEPTASVSVSSRGGSLPLDKFVAFLDSSVYLLRLVTGNRVSWYSGDALDDRSGEIVESIYNSCVTSPYTNTMRFAPLRPSQGPKVDFGALTYAFYQDHDHLVDTQKLKDLIDYFSSACDDQAYLQIRGLMASALTDLLVATYAQSTGTTEVIDRREFRNRTFPLIKGALANIDISEEVRKHLTTFLRGAYRTPFLQRLTRLVEDRHVPLESEELEKIVKIRNSLVHNGTYPSSQQPELWLNDYLSLMWTNFAILCRLLGYDGELPFFSDGGRLEI